MTATRVIAVFDIGKTNKKLMLMDETYRIAHEQSTVLPQMADEDGFPTEDIHALRNWMRESFNAALNNPAYQIAALQFSAYGASLVCTDASGQPVFPLYNYLKPYPDRLAQSLYEANGGKAAFSCRTASPALGSLNSGLQLYRLKMEQPEKFSRVHQVLHLPEFCSYLFSGEASCGLSSVGCHTALWDFNLWDYHPWVSENGLKALLLPPQPEHAITSGTIEKEDCIMGTGVHDSSAALLPYLRSGGQDFLLLSTGTWNIGLHPFNHAPLTMDELESDCLFYISPYGKPVKAARYFAGQKHEQIIASLAEKYRQPASYFHAMGNGTLDSLVRAEEMDYVRAMQVLVAEQAKSVQLLIQNHPVGCIYVDGGFSRNLPFMQLLANAFPSIRVYASAVAQGSARGAAMLIHDAWNPNPLPDNALELIPYFPNS